MAKEKSYRKHRFKRDPGAGMRLEKRDINVLKLLYDNRLLNSGQIQIATPGSNQNILRRLRKLYDNGYLDCLETSVYEKKIFALGNKGADVISTYYGIDRGSINWSKKNKEIKDYYFLEHTLMIANFRIALELALKEHPKSGINFWQPESWFKRSVRIHDKGKEKKENINPDSYFSLQCPEDTESEFIFFLEADRSTMVHQRILNRMKAYWSYYKSIKEGRVEGDFFRVLTVTKTEERKNNLRELAREADGTKTGSNLFWFTSEERYSLENPQTILGPMWQTPRSDDFHCLLE